MLTLLLAGARAAFAQAGASGIAQPASGETVSGTIAVTGTAVDGNFLRYELAFRPESGSDDDWIVFAEGDAPVRNGTLAIWDTTVGREQNAAVWPDGLYRLRLRVVRTDYNYSEHFVSGLAVLNDNTPTPTPAPVEQDPAGTPPPLTSGGGDFAVLTPIPSLTPFPTPTSPATPLAAAAAVADRQPPTPQGVLGQLAQADTGRLSNAFWFGVRLTGYLFGALLIYLLLRAAGRHAWRALWGRGSKLL